MTIDLAQINFTALAPAQRLLLAQALLDSVMFDAASSRNDLSALQLADLRSRADDIRYGRVACEPWETVLARLQSRFSP